MIQTRPKQISVILVIQTPELFFAWRQKASFPALVASGAMAIRLLELNYYWLYCEIVVTREA
jgi:hypothetical protein